MRLAYHRPAIKLGSFSFSEIEIKDLILAWLAISFAFGNLLGTGSLYMSFIISSITVGVGFIFHELGHKFMAQRYGAWAEFRAFKQMLVFAIIMSFFGFIFAAPGAVMIQGRTIGKSRYGKIAAAGPIMNFILAPLFLGLGMLYQNSMIQLISLYGFRINAWLGLFNMLPFGMFDGKKILNWNKVIYGILVAIGLVMVFFV
ncbi:site-2 protease family protein [Candidatus Woesearchaeota archaeon]|nr:site-2 protease family protein [Candidatus Woesearchaeota archaeon]